MLHVAIFIVMIEFKTQLASDTTASSISRPDSRLYAWNFLLDLSEASGQLHWAFYASTRNVH